MVTQGFSGRGNPNVMRRPIGFSLGHFSFASDALINAKGKEVCFANTDIPAVYALPPGALVSLERAVALGRAWTYAPPALAGMVDGGISPRRVLRPRCGGT